MGFGLLFIGFFFLLNLTYYGYTDIIGGLIMFMALYKLQTTNKYFRFALIPTGLFSVIGAIELIEASLSTFGFNMGFIIDYTASSRYFLIGFITIFMLMGIESVAKEVDVLVTRTRAKMLIPFTYLLYALAAAFEYPSLGNVFSPYVISVIATVLLFLVFIIMILTLATIYSAYVHICMPEDVDNDVKNTPSKYEFVNKFKAHEEKQIREYAEYRYEKSVKKTAKRKGKKK